VINASLIPPKFVPLPVGSLEPEGWLKDQLEIQANGLSGHLHLFWADVENSSWIGGKADTGLHERTPYWLNGFVPLAYQLNNKTLIGIVEKYIWYILGHQTSDGWLGEDDIGDGNSYWSKYPILFALRMYFEATANSTILPAMYKFLHTAYQRLFTTPLGVTWSGARAQDLAITVHWLLDNQPNGEQQFLWDLAEMLHQQAFSWNEFFAGQDFPKESVGATTLYTHGVNVGQALKSGGVWYRQTHNTTDRDSSYQRVAILDQYHGQASGIFSCDEHLAGLMPSRGTELCTVVEAMYSYEVLFSIHGDPLFAERAEQIGYNALPATITPDMWAHQYLQQDNEMNAIHSDDHVWQHDGPDSTLYGLAPNYGCCTGNFNQGWPKLLQNAVMTASDGTVIVFAILAPLTVDIPGFNLTVSTDYPFNDIVYITGTCSDDNSILIRIPSWAEGATMSWGSTPPRPIKAGQLEGASCNSVAVEIAVNLPAKVRVVRRYNNAASIYRGALLYGLKIEEEFKTLRSYAFNSKDYQITPGSDWNYAIYLNDPATDLKFQSTGLIKGKTPFSIDGAPTKITAIGSKVTGWTTKDNAAAPPPVSPVPRSSTDQSNTSIVLIPFGSTDLRIAEIPTYT
jgi:hypothetical protein